MTARSTDPRAPADERWDAKWSNPVFSVSERGIRWGKVRRLMVRDGIDVVVCLPSTHHHARGTADARYLTQLGENSEETIVAFPVEGEVTAWQSRPGVWPSSIWLTDIRAARRGAGAATLVSWLREHPEYERSRIAISGLTSNDVTHVRAAEGEVNYQSVEILKKALPHAEFVSASNVLGQARWVKSDEEIAFLRRATEVAEVTAKAMRETARAGVRERRVFAAMMYANADADGSFTPMFGWVSGRQGLPYHRLEQPTTRTLEEGDFLCIEIEGRWAGHLAQIDETALISYAESFTEAAAKMNEEVFHKVLALMKPGTTFGELDAAAQISGLGGRLVAGLGLHGRGNGDDGPLLTARRSPPPSPLREMTMDEGCCFALKPSVTLDNRAEVFRWGDSVVVTKTGGVRLGTRPFAMHILK